MSENRVTLNESAFLKMEHELTRLREERDRYRKFAEYVSLHSNDPAICIEAHKLLSGSEGDVRKCKETHAWVWMCPVCGEKK